MTIDRVLVEERVRPAAGVHDALELAVGLVDRRDLRVRAVLCECVSLSGSESSRKSKRSCSTRYAPTQPECWSRRPGMPELAAAAGVLREAKTSA